jgi:predicted N-acetyltransferase YhbS
LNVTEPEISIRPLREGDERASFRSGNPDLDRFFLRYAGQNQFKHHLGVTYEALAKGTIAGYVTLSAGSIQAESLPRATRRKLPRYPLPILRLARLAVDQAFAGRGIGLKLLESACLLALEMERLAGCVGVVVDSKPDALAFYERLGFKAFETVDVALQERPTPVTMFLPLGAIPHTAQNS